MAHANCNTGSDVLHGEDTGGNQNDKRGGRLESHGARDKFEPQGREIRSEADGELVVREVLGVGTEVVVEGHEDRNGGYEVRGGAGVGRSDVEEGRVERELGIEEHEREVGMGESDLDEERAVLELLGVQVGELERELEESEVEALLLGLDQPDDGEEARQLTISLRWLSLSDIQRDPVLTEAEDAMDVDTPERDENAMDVDNVPFL